MNNAHDTIVQAQVIAKDTVAAVSAMLNQDDISRDKLEHLQTRLEELTELLNSIDEDKAGE